MPRDPQTTASPNGLGSQEMTDASDGHAQAAPTRAAYKAPSLRRLGSVRDLTLGSPLLPFGDLMGGFQRVPM